MREVLIAEYLVIKNEYQGGLKTWRAGRCAATFGAALTGVSWKFSHKEQKQQKNWVFLRSMCFDEGKSVYLHCAEEGMRFPIHFC